MLSIHGFICLSLTAHSLLQNTNERSHDTMMDEVTRMVPHVRLSTRNRRFPQASDRSMVGALDRWRSDLGIDRAGLDCPQIDIKDVQIRVSQARQFVQDGLFPSARRIMAEAQERWRPEMGIERPGFSFDELRQIYTQEVQKLAAKARHFAQDGRFSTARRVMASAQERWTPDMGTARPEFSVEEESRIMAAPSFMNNIPLKEEFSRLFREPVPSHTPCMICLDVMPAGAIEALGSCTHRFHDKCITEWLIQKNACPLCRQKWL